MDNVSLGLPKLIRSVFKGPNLKGTRYSLSILPLDNSRMTAVVGGNSHKSQQCQWLITVLVGTERAYIIEWVILSGRDQKQMTFTTYQELHKEAHFFQTADSFVPRSYFATMTLAKLEFSSSAKHISLKDSSKRVVSFGKSVKFEAPNKPESSGSADASLQSIDKRRRYMRRGSKCPSMLLMSHDQIQKLESECEVEKVTFASNKERRLSLMSALRINLERAAIVDPNVASQIRSMSPDEKRNFTFELLSKV